MIKHTCNGWRAYSGCCSLYAVVAIILFYAVIIPAQAAGTLSERNYLKLQEVHKLISKEKYKKAEVLLQQMLVKKSTAYEKALFLQTAAHISIVRDQYDKAISQMEEALALRAVPEFVSKNLQYNLAQLYAQQDDFKNSLRVLILWLKGKQKLNVDHHVFAANVYANNSQSKTAIVHLQQAIEQSKKPAEAWYQMLIALHLKLKQYKQAIPIYHTLIHRFTKKKEYWKQLSGLYLQLGKNHQALALFRFAYRQGLLTQEKEILRLANLYLALNIPYSAAKLLQTNLKTQRLQSTAVNLVLLADSWSMAREYNRAIEILQQAAKLDKTSGQLHVRSARLLIEQERWQEAMTSLEQALQQGGLKKPGEAYLLQGIAAYYASKHDKAMWAFNKAAKYTKFKKQARAWMRQFE